MSEPRVIRLAPLWAEMMRKYTGIQLEASTEHADTDGEGRTAWVTTDEQIDEMTRHLLTKRDECGFLWSDGDGRCFDAWRMATNQAELR